MNYDKLAARRAGLFYLAAAFFYIFGMMYVEGRVSVAGDVAATLRNIAGSGTLYRLGFLSTLLGHVCLLLVAAALYELFSPVDAGWARLIVIFVVTGVSIAFLNRSHQLVILRLAGSPGPGLSASTSEGLALLYLDLFKDGEKLAGMFWGLWLLPVGVLAIKSGFAPKALGATLICACAFYLMTFAEHFLLGPSPAVLPALPALYRKVDTLVKMAAELGFIAWLLVAGFSRRIGAKRALSAPAAGV